MQFALPDLAGFVAAGFLLLLACAIGLLAALLANTLGKAPIIGPWVNRDLVPWCRDGQRKVLAGASATWHFATGMINWAWDILTKPLIYLYHYASASWQWLQTLFTQTIPDAENRVVNYALNLAGELRAGFDAQVKAVENDLRGDYNALAARITNVENAAFGEAAKAEAQAVTVAHGLVSGLTTDLDHTADSIVSVVWPDAVDDVQALRRAIGTGFPGVNDLLGALGGLGTAGLLGLLIRSLAGTAAVTELATDCIVPNCENLGQLGKDLAELTSVASEAALIAWLVFCVTDPAGAARDIQLVALNPLRTVMGNFSRLVGGP